jgi:glycosyltransferase involved in cell wall biosynthesis
VIERGILYIVDASSNSIKQNVSVLLKHLNRARYIPYLAISDDANVAERLREANIEYKIIPEIATAGKFNVGGVAKQIAQFVEGKTINLIHSHDVQGCFVATQVAAQLGAPHVNTVYASLADEKKKKGFFAVADDRIVSGANHLIAVSEEIKKSIEPLNNVTLIRNAVEADRFAETLDTDHLIRELDLNKDDIIVGTFASLNSDEDIKLVLEVAKILTSKNEKLHFVVAGSGQNSENVKKKVAEMGIGKRLHLLGYRRDVAHILKSLNVVLVLAKKAEIPLILLEALAGIRPVVVTDTPAAREVVNEESAKFAKPGDPISVAEAIEYLLTNNGEAVDKASAGHKIVSELFTVERMLKPTQTLYLQIAG